MSRDRQRAERDPQPVEEQHRHQTAEVTPQVANRALAGAVQTKLEVGAAGDRYEQHADKVADAVVGRMAQRHSGHDDDVQLSRIQRSEAAEMEDEELQLSRIQRSEAAEMEDEELQLSRIQRSNEAPVVGAEGGTLDQATEAAIARAGSGGRPLDTSLRRDMGAAMGADFSSVRVHTGPESDRLNSALQSQAFTTGSNVFVRSQDYRPGNTAGQRLLAHELTHVVQQGAAPKVERHPEE